MSARYAHDWRERQRVQTCMDKDAWSSWHSPSISLPNVPSVFRQKRKHSMRAYVLKRGKGKGEREAICYPDKGVDEQIFTFFKAL